VERIRLHQFAEKLTLAGYSRRCCEDYPRVVGHFFDYLDEHESVELLEQVSEEHIKAYQTHVQFAHLNKGKPLSVGGVCTRLTPLKTFLRVMHREGLMVEELSRFVVLPRHRRHLPRNVPTQEQMRKLLAQADSHTPLGLRDRAILETLYATGLRSEELRGLEVDDWDRQSNTLLVHGKGSKERVVPLGRWVRPYLRRYLEKARPTLAGYPQGLLFVSKSGRHIARSNLAQLVRRYVKKAGLVGVTVHSLRHACATHLLENGADIRYIQELLGHADLSATQIYTRVDIRSLKAAHHRFHPREREVDDA
jgi:integrase/recombinase XerD